MTLISEVSDLNVWYAFYTKPKSEFKAEARLQADGFETYLASVRKVKKWSDRNKVIYEPVLPGYIFVRTTPRLRESVLQNPMMVRCLYEHGRPAVIPGWEIDNLKEFLSHDTKYRVLNSFVKGTKVRIREGAFKDVVGIILDGTEQKSFAVAIELLNRTIITHFPDGSVFEIVKSST